MAKTSSYPVLVLCGRDRGRRGMLDQLDPDNIYPSKVLLPMHGKPLLEWQIEALQASPYVRKLYLIGLQEDDYPFSPDIQIIPFETASSIQDKILAGWNAISGLDDDLEHLVISTADAPAITTSSINQFFSALEQNQDADILLAGVPEYITDREIPDHKRFIAKFTDKPVHIGEMGALRGQSIPILVNEIESLTNWARQLKRLDGNVKTSSVLSFLAFNPSLTLKIFQYFSRRPELIRLMYKYYSGSLSLPEFERIFSSYLGLELRVTIIPDAGFGMDMDLAEDYQKLSDYLTRTKLTVV